MDIIELIAIIVLIAAIVFLIYYYIELTYLKMTSNLYEYVFSIQNPNIKKSIVLSMIF